MEKMLLVLTTIPYLACVPKNCKSNEDVSSSFTIVIGPLNSFKNTYCLNNPSRTLKCTNKK